MGVPPTKDAFEQPVVSQWPSTPRSAQRARHRLRDVLRQWDLTGLSDSAELVLTELISNSVQHAKVQGRHIETRFVCEGEGLRIEVHDASEKQPRQLTAGDEDERGRGLALVAALAGANGWGVSEREGVGKLVWVTLSAAGIGEDA